MKVGDYEFVHYESRYKDELIELLTPLWGDNKEVKTAYFDWKHLNNPYAKHPIIYMALHQGQVVGVTTFHVCYWQAGQPEQKLLCLSNADAVVHPDHRRFGLLKNMTFIGLKELEREPYFFNITLSAASTSGACAIKLGWRNVGELRTMDWFAGVQEGRWRRIVRKMPLVSKICHRFNSARKSMISTGALLHSFSDLEHNISRTAKNDHPKIVIESQPRSEEMALLATQLNADGKIRHVKDRQFYEWRFKNPKSDYRFLFAEGNKLQGYIVIQQQKKSISKSISIVDWEVKSVDILSQLIKTVVLLGGFQHINIWSTSLNDDENNVLTACGFLPNDKHVTPNSNTYFSPILVKPVRQEFGWSMGGCDVMDISNWDLRPIYSDSY